MENQLPKYFIFDRRAVGTLETAKRIVEVLAGASVGSAVVVDSLTATAPLALALAKKQLDDDINVMLPGGVASYFVTAIAYS